MEKKFEELEQLLDSVANWPADVQQKVLDAIRAIQAEYIDGSADNNF
jgi:hypothetical protein